MLPGNGHGIAEFTGPRGCITLATITCAHCNRVTIIPLGEREEDCSRSCAQCSNPTCMECADKPCTPFESVLRGMEQAGA